MKNWATSFLVNFGPRGGRYSWRFSADAAAVSSSLRCFEATRPGRTVMVGETKKVARELREDKKLQKSFFSTEKTLKIPTPFKWPLARRVLGNSSWNPLSPKRGSLGKRIVSPRHWLTSVLFTVVQMASSDRFWTGDFHCSLCAEPAIFPRAVWPSVEIDGEASSQNIANSRLSLCIGIYGQAFLSRLLFFWNKNDRVARWALGSSNCSCQSARGLLRWIYPLNFFDHFSKMHQEPPIGNWCTWLKNYSMLKFELDSTMMQRFKSIDPKTSFWVSHLPANFASPSKRSLFPRHFS